MSQEAGYFDRREGTLRQLDLLGSMDAIQQIGRFLEDTRNPDHATAMFMINSGMSPPQRNLVGAASALILALGDAAPVQLSDADMHTLQEWWKSDAAKRYRDWTYENGLPMPPPRLKSDFTVQLKVPVQVVNKQALDTKVPVAEEATKPWIIWLIVAAGSSLTVLLSALGREH